MRKLIALLALSGCACTGSIYRTNMPRPPVCVRGGIEPVSMSMSDYGTTYTPDLTGTTEAVPYSYLVRQDQAGPDCVAPPWWSPRE